MGDTVLLGLASILAFVSGSGLIYVALRYFLPAIREFISVQEAQVGEALKDIFFTGFSARFLVYLKYGGAPLVAVLFFVATGKAVFALALAVILFVVPGLIIDYEQRSRRERLVVQVNDLIAAISANTKSGMNLIQSIEEVALKFPAPMSQEFKMIYERIRSGQTVETALLATDRRLQIPSLSLVFQSLIVNLQRGGKLVALLERLGHSLQEISRVEEKVRTETSGIKLSSKLMAAMPFLMGIMLYFMSPENILMLFQTVIGNVILVVAALFDYIGFTMIKKIADIDA